MYSSTTTDRPARTASPSDTSTLTTVPIRGAVTAMAPSSWGEVAIAPCWPTRPSGREPSPPSPPDAGASGAGATVADPLGVGQEVGLVTAGESAELFRMHAHTVRSVADRTGPQ